MDARYQEVKEEKNDEVLIDKQNQVETPGLVLADQSYGRSQEPLDGPIAVRWLSGSGNTPYVVTQNVNTTGNITITGCPFQPTSVDVTGVIGFVGCLSYSRGISTGDVGKFVGWADGLTETGNYIVQLRDNGWTVTHRATLTSLNSDGCTINFSIASTTISLLIILS